VAICIRIHDFEWKKIFADWSNYDLDALAREIEEEKNRRNAKPHKPFRG